MNYDDKNDNEYQIEWHGVEPIARVTIDGTPTSAYISLGDPIYHNQKPDWLDDEQWAQAVEMQTRDNEKPF